MAGRLKALSRQVTRMSVIKRLKAENALYRQMGELNKYAAIFFEKGVKAEKAEQAKREAEQHGQSTEASDNPPN